MSEKQTRSLKLTVVGSSLRERTTERLREAILDMHFTPGEKLVERRLCEEIGVSRTCIREALRCLEGEGLVISTTNRGMFVAKIGWPEARQIYEIRRVLESEMARLFTERASDAQIAALKSAFRRLERTVLKDRGSDADYISDFEAVFEQIFAGANNDIAWQVLKSLRARITYLRLMTARVASHEHREMTLALVRTLVEALSRRDGVAAEKDCRAFIVRSMAFAKLFFDLNDPERIGLAS
ncbi:MAG: GntR family transcriptional regulator [Pseudorhodoplanes sp.]